MTAPSQDALEQALKDPAAFAASAPFPLSNADREVLATKPEEFHHQTWEDLREIIATNSLQVLKRTPTDLIRYIHWSNSTGAKYGSIPNYILLERLHWTPLPTSTPENGPHFATASPTPFTDPTDYRILPNDWPYGLEPGIIHLVVWLKHRLDAEPERGDLTPTSRAQVEGFIQRVFLDRVKDLPGGRRKVQWFKNWRALQSVPGMEHVHVLVRDVPEDVVLEWTGGEELVQEGGRKVSFSVAAGNESRGGRMERR